MPLECSDRLPDEQIVMPNSQPKNWLKGEILDDATSAECSLPAMLALECTVRRGELTAESRAGTILYSTAVSPRYLESSLPTRISVISSLFEQWRGHIAFRLYVTKAIFQQTKLLMVFVPGMIPADIKSVPVESLLGYQIRTVLNPSNEVVAELEVPFIATGNWQHVNGSIGTFAVVQLERIVVTQQSTSTIPWILTCCSPRGRDQLRFRYAVVPALTPSGDDSGSTDSGISMVSRVGSLYAQTSSSRRRARLLGARLVSTEHLCAATPLVGGPPDLVAGIAINWSRCPSTAVLARRLARLPLAPPFSFVVDAPLSQKSILPILPTINWLQGPLPNGETGYGTSYDWFYCNSNNSIEGEAVYFGGTQGSIEFRIGVNTEEVEEFLGWLVDLIYFDARSNRTEMIVFRVERGDGTKQIKLVYERQTAPAVFSGFGMKVGYPLQWVDDPQNYTAGPLIENFLVKQIERARSLAMAPYFMLWTSGSDLTARNIRDWLYAAESETVPPKMAQGSLVAFSPSQAPWAYSMYPVDEERGIFTWIFSLFSSDDTSPLYTVARVADCIFEFVVPLLLSREGEPAVMDARTMLYEYDHIEDTQQPLVARARLASVAMSRVLRLPAGEPAVEDEVDRLRRALALARATGADTPPPFA